jgi:hypothetical protein
VSASESESASEAEAEYESESWSGSGSDSEFESDAGTDQASSFAARWGAALRGRGAADDSRRARDGVGDETPTALVLPRFASRPRRVALAGRPVPPVALASALVNIAVLRLRLPRTDLRFGLGASGVALAAVAAADSLALGLGLGVDFGLESCAGRLERLEAGAIGCFETFETGKDVIDLRVARMRPRRDFVGNLASERRIARSLRDWC